jgi:transglutaminase-like putative cysteine protease
MGSEARARIGLVGLLLVTLFAFSQLFGGGDYVGPSLLAMAFSIGISMGMRRLGAGAVTTMFVSATGLLCYLSWIFEGSSSWFLIPTPASIRGLADSIGVALDNAATDYAPIPVRPGYVILTTAGLWILSTIGEVGTFRWRRPLVASIGSVALFSFVMVVGSREGAWLLVTIFLVALFTYWSLEAAHRLRSWGNWVTAWRAEHSEPPVLTHSTARRMGASSILIALVVPLFMPAVGDAFLSWKSGLGDGSGPGGGGGTSINPLVSIAPKLIEQSEVELFTVKIPEGTQTRWRLNTLEEVDGDVWRPRVGRTDEGVELPAEVVDLPARERRARFTIANLEGAYLPTRYPTREVSVLEGGEAGLDQTSVDTAALNKDLLIDEDAAPGLVYEVVSHEPNPEYKELLRAEASLPGAPDFLTAVPGGELHPDILELRDSWIEGIEGDFETLQAIQDRFQGPEFFYSLEVGREEESAEPPEEGHLYNFLLNTKTGYCQQYATAFAALSRSLGYPTRIAVGFLPGSAVEGDSTTFSVTGDAAHAWPEVFFEGIGWIPFEPTPRTDLAVPLPSFMSPPVQAGSEPCDGIQSSAGQGCLDTSANNGNEATDPRGERPENPREEVRADATLPGDLEQAEGMNDSWKEPFARLATMALLALLLFLLAVPSLKEWRANRRYRRAATPAGRATAAFAQFEQEAAELAARRRRSESAPAYAKRVSDIARIDDDTALRLASIYEKAEYGGNEISTNVADEARRIARSLRSSLWKNAGWWQRAQRLFSPNGLRVG